MQEVFAWEVSLPLRWHQGSPSIGLGAHFVEAGSRSTSRSVKVL